MNGTYFQNPSFPESQNSGLTIDNDGEFKILKNNVGKKVKVYAYFPEKAEGSERTLTGIVENTTEHQLMLSDPSNGNWFLLPLKYITYIEFEEKIIY